MFFNNGAGPFNPSSYSIIVSIFFLTLLHFPSLIGLVRSCYVPGTVLGFGGLRSLGPVPALYHLEKSQTTDREHPTGPRCQGGPQVWERGSS